MNHSLERHDYLGRHLVALGDAYALRAMHAAGDDARLRALTDHYLRDAMVLLSGTHGSACAQQVRQRVRRDRDARGGGGSTRPRRQSLLQRVGNALRTYTLQWHRQVIELGGAH